MATSTGKQGVPSLPKRLLWFVMLWLGGVAAVAIVGLMIKLALRG